MRKIPTIARGRQATWPAISLCKATRAFSFSSTIVRAVTWPETGALYMPAWPGPFSTHLAFAVVTRVCFDPVSPLLVP